MKNKDDKVVNLIIACILLDGIPFKGFRESALKMSELTNFIPYSKWAHSFVRSDIETKVSYLIKKVIDVKFIISRVGVKQK